MLQTTRRDGLLIERSGDMFTTKDPAAFHLAERLGMASLLPTNETKRGAFVVHRGELVPVPKGFVLLRPTRWDSVLRSSLLSWSGKLRLLAERLVPARNASNDESLRDFTVRRLGRQAFERLIQPLVGGIYTADPNRLSMQATMSEFVALEQTYGRLTFLPDPMGAPGERTADGARYGAFLAPCGGMQELIDALACRLGGENCRLQTRVTRVESSIGGGWLVWTDGPPKPPTRYDAVIVATPAPQAAALLRSADSKASDLLAGIPYAGVAIAVFCFGRDQLTRYRPAFGLVVPAVERRSILAASFASEKFPGRAGDDEVLIRVFLGGALQSHLLRASDQALLESARNELSDLVGANGQPRYQELIRWDSAMPQYHLGHVDRVRRLEERIESLRSLELAGNAYHGVGRTGLHPQRRAGGGAGAGRSDAVCRFPQILAAGVIFFQPRLIHEPGRTIAGAVRGGQGRAADRAA